MGRSLIGRGGEPFRPPKGAEATAGLAPTWACAFAWRLFPSLVVFLSFVLGFEAWPPRASEDAVLVGSMNGARGGCADESLCSERPNPKRRRIGLIGGTGGGGSMPFFKDAPAGKSTVSMTEVPETKIGSEISDFTIDFLRTGPVFPKGAGLNDAATGVFGPETGGVLLAENGGTGDCCGRKEFMLGLGAPGEGLGDTGNAGEMPGFELEAGESRGGAPLAGPLPVWIGWRCFWSK